MISSHLSPPRESQVSVIFGVEPNRLRLEPCARGVRTMPAAKASSRRR
jgi:hypothetical protein